MKNQTSQGPRLNHEKEAKISFFLGIITQGGLFLMSSHFGELILDKFPFFQRLIYPSLFLLSLSSIGFGIMGLKSKKKLFAIIGIAASCIVLYFIVPALIFIFFYNP